MKSIVLKAAVALLLFFLFPGHPFGQKVAETPAGALADQSFSLINTNPDSALKIGKLGIALARKTNDRPGYAACLNRTGLAYYRIGNNDSAEDDFKASAAVYEALHDKHNEARVLINLCALYTDKELYEQGMQTVLKAKSYMAAINDESGAAYAENMIGILYRQQENYDQAILHQRNAINDFRRLGEHAYEADATESMGNIFRKTGNADSAFYYYYNALKIYTGIANTTGMAYVNENIGDAYYKSANGQPGRFLDSSLLYYKAAFALFSKQHSPQNIAYEKMMIGTLLVAKAQPGLAEAYLKEALATFEAGRNYNYASQTLDVLKTLEKEAGHYQQAFAYAAQEIIYNDTLASGNRKEVMATMFAKYEVDKRDRTIALLNTQKKLANQELSHRRTMDLIYFALALIMIVVSLILLQLSRVRQQLREFKMRNQIAYDLHDEVGSSLSSVLLLSKMALSKKDDEPFRERLLGNIKRHATDVIDRMGDIVWVTDPQFDKGENMQQRMENYLSGIQDSTGLEVTTEFSPSIANMSFSMLARKNIFLIFKEAVNNVTKHAGATGLKLGFLRHDRHFTLTICDNGTGFDTATPYTGIGLDTMRQRALALNGVLKIIPGKTNGTCVLLELPLNFADKTVAK